MSIKVIQGIGPLGDAVKRVQDAVAKPEVPLKVMAISVMGWIDRNFASGGNPTWKPLAASTQAAKRKGGGGKPLQELRQTFVTEAVGARRVDIFSRNPNAIFHEFGTKGPYEIKPKNAKALALPYLPGRDAPQGKASVAGEFSYKGLGRAKRLPTGQLKAASGPRAGKTVAPYSKMTFRMKVIHPGNAARPMLPTEEQAVPYMTKALDAYLATLVK